MPSVAKAGGLDQSRCGDPASIVEISGFRMSYRLGGTSFTVLDIGKLELPAGISIGLSGPSGSGKSTLPFNFGDSYRSHLIVGTTSDYLRLLGASPGSQRCGPSERRARKCSA